MNDFYNFCSFGDQWHQCNPGAALHKLDEGLEENEYILSLLGLYNQQVELWFPLNAADSFPVGQRPGQRFFRVNSSSLEGIYS